MIKDYQDIKSIFQDYYFKSPNKLKFVEAYLRSKWKQIMPNAILERTQKFKVYKETLYIYIDSSALRNELQLLEIDIYNKLIIENNNLDTNYINSIKKIVFTG